MCESDNGESGRERAVNSKVREGSQKGMDDDRERDERLSS